MACLYADCYHVNYKFKYPYSSEQSSKTQGKYSYRINIFSSDILNATVR